jgi:hypothetical protein
MQLFPTFCRCLRFRLLNCCRSVLNWLFGDFWIISLIS